MINMNESSKNLKNKKKKTTENNIETINYLAFEINYLSNKY
jgi:hypothetical protein